MHYQRGNWFGKYVLNGIVALLARLGVSLWDSRVLRVRGRKSGRLFTTPVNLLTIEGRRYLVAPRGHTQWVRNLRVAGEGELLLGRRVERFDAVEVADDRNVAILRAYLRRWKFEVGMFFHGVDADSPEADLARIAPDHPVFLIQPAR
jgi:deazaflavin-dependent oxidoreductase (nitroreductase family)